MPKGFLRTALALVAATVGGTATADDAKLVQRLYPVGDFVYSSIRPAPVPTAPVPVVAPCPAPQLAAPVPAPPQQLPPEARGNAEALIRLVQGTVKPYSWAGVGGDGRITFDPTTNSLVVTQSADVHAHVADLLAAMRRVHAASMPQVMLDLTLVEVAEPVFEQLGANLDLTVRTAKPEREPGRAMKVVRSAVGGKTPVALLSDAQAAGLRERLKSARENGKAKFVSEPKVMTADGRAGYFRVGGTARYLTKLELTAGPNGVERKPQYKTIQLGTTIAVTPKVSADRRSVLLHLDYQTAQPSVVASALAVKVSDEGAAEVLGAPAINTQEVRAAVMVPSGKTLLLAGPVTTREQEFGQPLLTSVPNMDRLIVRVNRGVSQQTCRHLLLVTAKVVSPPGDCCAASGCPAACPAADCKACPVTADDAKLVKRSYMVGEFTAPARPTPTPPAPVPPVPVMPTVTPEQAAQFAAPVPTPPPVRQVLPEGRRDVEALARMLVNVVKPYSWTGMGGNGSITFDPKTCSLVITQTADVHAHIAGLLTAMRQIQTASVPMVLLDLAVVEVPETLSETVGPEDDGAVRPVSGRAVPGECSPPNWAAWARRAERTAGSPKPPTVALSDDQVKCLLKDCRAEVLTRPQMMLPDTQEGFCHVGQAVQVENGPGVFTDVGMTIRATPKVSADRRFVELRLNYQTVQPNRVVLNLGNEGAAGERTATALD
ncbi:MAG TPA: hypothetical protein VFG68_20765, partial [Fimbriiglobus sp.]|nr:hypothetical protein [Fimbriiglobus sp.]